MRVLIVEDEPYMAEAIRDGLRLEAIAADIAADGDTALQLLSINAYDIAVLDRDIPGPSGDEVAGRIVASRQRHADPHAHRNRAPCGSRPAFTPSVWCSPSRTPASSSPHSWIPRLSSRFLAAPNAYAPTTRVSASAWQ